MSSEPNAPRPVDSLDDETMRHQDSASEAQDGLADAEAAEHFKDAVEQRLTAREPTDSASHEARPEMEVDEDSPVRADNPE